MISEKLIAFFLILSVLSIVFSAKDRDRLLNDGKKWNRKVGAEYFCKKEFVPKAAVVFAWNWDAQEKRGAWGVHGFRDRASHNRPIKL